MQYLTPEELRRLFQVAYDRDRHRHLLMVTVFWHGSRVSETLEVQGCDIQDGKILIRRKKGSITTRQDIHKDKDPLFDESPIIKLAKKPGPIWPYSRFQMHKFIRLCGRKAGVDASKLHMHALKHSTAMVLWDASGGNLGLLQLHLGHKSASSSLIYLREVDSQKASDVMNAVTL
jgi:integrase